MGGVAVVPIGVPEAIGVAVAVAIAFPGGLVSRPAANAGPPTPIATAAKAASHTQDRLLGAVRL